MAWAVLAGQPGQGAWQPDHGLDRRRSGPGSARGPGSPYRDPRTCPGVGAAAEVFYPVTALRPNHASMTERER